jgi:hypothetical protein
VLREELLGRHFGPAVHVMTTDTGDIAVISRRLPRGAATGA